MRKINLFFALILAVCVCSNSYAKRVRTTQNETDVYMNIVVKQLSASIDKNGLITASYNNGNTLYFTILDNFGNVALTWDRSNNRQSFDDGNSSYKGNIDIPAFITIESKGQKEDDIVMTFNVCEIAENAFNGCSELTSVTIPYSVRNIRQNAFKGCYNIQNFSVNENNGVYMSQDGILFSKSQNILIYYPTQKQDSEYTIPEQTTIICPESFQSNKYLLSVTVGNNVTAISDFAFRNCSNLEKISLGNSVRIIGKFAFSGCPSLKEIRSTNIFPPHNCPIVFDREIKSTCNVIVPTGQTANYKSRLEWGDFQNFTEE